MLFADSQVSVDIDEDLCHESECSQGHRSTLSISTVEGGRICLLCFSNLLTASSPRAPTLHVSYALSQLSHALTQPQFVNSLLSLHHVNLIVSPLLIALSSFDDQPIACQLIEVITTLCDTDVEVLAEFTARIAKRIASGALAWSRRQIYMLHCFGLLLNRSSDTNDLNAYIKDKYALVSILVSALDLPSEEIQGEILFVLYKLSILQYASADDHTIDILNSFVPKLLHTSLQVLLKTQADDVRLNCIALLTIMAKKGFFGKVHVNDTSSMSSDEADNFMPMTEDGLDGPPLSVLFAEAIKGPILSSDSQVQISTVDLLCHYMSTEDNAEEKMIALVKENIADYVFEILRQSKCEDMVVDSCLRVLSLFSEADQAFRERLVVGFPTLIRVLHYVAEIPFHPSQSLTLKLLWSCLSDCPGILSTSHVHELIIVLTRMVKRHTDEQTSILPETFIMACSIFVSLLKSPSFLETSYLPASVQDVSKHAVLSCFTTSEKDSSQLLHSLFLLKEAYAYSLEKSSTSSSGKVELRNSILDVSVSHLLPWFMTNVNQITAEVVLGIFETFNFILLQNSDTQVTQFAKALASSSWMSLSFGCLGLFPSENVKWRVYLMLSSLIDVLLGDDTGKPIRDSALFLPSDPSDLLFLLGQKNSHNFQLCTSQLAFLLILHVASLFDDSKDKQFITERKSRESMRQTEVQVAKRLADEKLVLLSLEQYILVNGNSLLHGAADTLIMIPLVNLYCLHRGLAGMNYNFSYNLEAERIFFNILTTNSWDFPSAINNPVSVKWMFQQQKISKLLSYQLLKFCQSNSNSSTVHKNYHVVNVKMVSELVAAGDNYTATLLISLLDQLVEEQGLENDILSVVNLMVSIIKNYPNASDQFCFHGIAYVIQKLHDNPHYASPQLSETISLLLFNILCFVQPKAISAEEPWLDMAMKLINYLVQTAAAGSWCDTGLLVIGIFCLILVKSTKLMFVEVSKAILFNASLVATIDRVISAACLKGPALCDCDEETSTGENLIFILLLYNFSLRSLDVVLPGPVDWQDFIHSSNEMLPISMINIPCDNLCRLMHFGPPPVKLTASYCLLQLFTRFSDQESIKQVLNFSLSYLLSIMAILEGLVFYSDIRVAINCGRCLSIILEWEKPHIQETDIIAKTNWCKLIIEEMAMSLALPSLASKSSINLHKPALPIAIALLRFQTIPEWMRSVFDDSCISGIIENLKTSCVSADMVHFFRELLNSEFLNAEHLASLSQVLQACRKKLHMKTNYQDDNTDQDIDKRGTSDNLTEACEYLICLMSSSETRESKSEDETLLEEIDAFFEDINSEGL
ncbi:hypothetical protein ACFE04_004477 [Oxalis oulophora]